MEETKKTKISVIKTTLIVIPIVFVLLIIWIGSVYIGNVYLNLKVDANQYFIWLIQGTLIFIVYPFFSKIYLSRWISKKTDLNSNIKDLPKLTKTDWIFFAFLQLTGIFILAYFFIMKEFHLDTKLFFIKYFGVNWRGLENFPVLGLFIVTPLIILSLIYWLVTKYKYGTFDEPKFENNLRDNDFRQKRKIYFAFVISTTIITAFLYLFS